MADKRKIDAYDRRLAKITEEGDVRALQIRDIGATVTVIGPPYTDATPQTIGTLIGFEYKHAAGLFGPRIQTTLTICTDCPRCNSEPVVVVDPLLYEIKRTVKATS